jgi:hypothetical protein
MILFISKEVEKFSFALAFNYFIYAGLRIRLHYIRVRKRIQQFQEVSDPDPSIRMPHFAKKVLKSPLISVYFLQIYNCIKVSVLS